MPSSSPARDTGIVMLLTGEGWGKSASAFGYVLRARGLGWPAHVVQLLKGGAWNAAEISAARSLGARWPVMTPELTWAAGDPAALAQRAWRGALEVLTGPPVDRLLVLDEVTHAVDSGWVDAAEVVRGVRERTAGCSVVMTGRTAPEPLVQLADTVTHFDLVKHAGKHGILGS